MGQEHQFPPTTLSNRSRLGKPPFAGRAATSSMRPEPPFGPRAANTSVQPASGYHSRSAPQTASRSYGGLVIASCRREVRRRPAELVKYDAQLGLFVGGKHRRRYRQLWQSNRIEQRVYARLERRLRHGGARRGAPRAGQDVHACQGSNGKASSRVSALRCRQRPASIASLVRDEALCRCPSWSKGRSWPKIAGDLANSTTVHLIGQITLVGRSRNGADPDE